MPFTIPNAGAASDWWQADVDSGDVTILAAAAQGFGVVGGCQVTAQGTPNMTLLVSAGVTSHGPFGQAAVASQNVTVTTANATNPRIDLVVVDRTGAVSVVAGTPVAAVQGTSEPAYPAWTSSSVVLAAVSVGNGVTSITSAKITDKRVLLPADRQGTMSSRVAWLWPFTPDSMRNLPVANTATFQRSTDAATASFIATSTGGGTIVPWVTYQNYNIPIVKASTSDPLVTVTDTGDSTRSDVFRIPASAAPATGSDHALGVVTPDGRFMHEMWLATRTSSTVYSCSKHVKADLYGRGFGPGQGTHASDASLAGGVIREWEIYGGPEGYGEIRHGLTVGLDPTQLYYNSAAGGYGTDGYGRGTINAGWVWPAASQDFGSNTGYTGSCPMGSLAAIPPWVDVEGLGLSGPGRTVARALQRYGGIVDDQTGLTWSLYADFEIGGNHLSDWLQPVLNDLATIRAQCRVISNNTKLTPGGGIWTGDAGNRVAPLAPPLPAPPPGKVQ